MGNVQRLPLMQYVVRLAITEAIEELCCAKGLPEFDVRIKWPNGLYLKGLKVAGILCASSYQRKNYNICTGIGLKVDNEKPTTCLNAALQEVKANSPRLKREDILASFFNKFEVLFEIFSNQGFLAPEIGSLSSLQKLILDRNTLIGSMPKEIGKLKNLTVLDLSTNQLVGPIPSETGDMTKISKIDFHANRLNGAIPCELGKLTNLIELRLSNNSLTGIIPGSNDSSMVSTNSDDQIGLCQLTQLTDVDLSYNFLVGDIPTCFKQIKRSSLVGNCFQNNDTINRSAQQFMVVFHLAYYNHSCSLILF